MKKLFVGFVLLIQSLSFAQLTQSDAEMKFSPEIETLLAGEYRPTLEQILSLKSQYAEFTKLVDDRVVELGAQYNTNAYNRFTIQNVNSDSWTPDHIKNYLPQLLVALEKAYPDGNYAFLGRDVNLWGEALNAFYTHYKQPGRVYMLNASTPSFTNVTQKELVQFLLQNGLNPKLLTVKNPEEYQTLKPYVIFDRTSMGNGSQSTQLLSAVYAQAMKNGVPAELLPLKIFVATSAGNVQPLRNPLYRDILKGYGYQMKIVQKQIEHDYEMQKLYALQNGQDTSGITKADMNIHYNTPYRQYQPSTVATEFPTNDPRVQWHDSFGAFEKKQGQLIAAAGSQFDRSAKIWVIYNIIKAVETVRSNEVMQKVLEYAVYHNVPSVMQMAGEKNYKKMLEKQLADKWKLQKQAQKTAQTNLARNKHSELIRAKTEAASFVANLPTYNPKTDIPINAQDFTMSLSAHTLYLEYQKHKTQTAAYQLKALEGVYWSLAKQAYKENKISENDLGELARAFPPKTKMCKQVAGQ